MLENLKSKIFSNNCQKQNKNKTKLCHIQIDMFYCSI